MKKLPSPPAAKESQVVSACLQWLWLHGCYTWRNNTGKYQTTHVRKDGSMGKYQIAYGLSGSGDIVGMTPHGTFISVECKSDKGELQYNQIAFGERVKSCAGIYIVAHSIDDLESRKQEILA